MKDAVQKITMGDEALVYRSDWRENSRHIPECLLIDAPILIKKPLTMSVILHKLGFLNMKDTQ